MPHVAANATRTNIEISPTSRDGGSHDLAALESDRLKVMNVAVSAAPTNVGNQLPEAYLNAAIIADQFSLRLKPTVTAAASSSVSKNPKSQNHLAAAALVRWGMTRQLSDAVIAFDAAKLANAEDPELLDARYNLASAVEAMSLSLQDDARKSWEEYLSVDSTSDRAQQVRRYLNDQKRSDNSSELLLSATRSSLPVRDLFGPLHK